MQLPLALPPSLPPHCPLYMWHIDHERRVRALLSGCAAMLGD